MWQRTSPQRALELGNTLSGGGACGVYVLWRVAGHGDRSMGHEAHMGTAVEWTRNKRLPPTHAEYHIAFKTMGCLTRMRNETAGGKGFVVGEQEV